MILRTRQQNQALELLSRSVFQNKNFEQTFSLSAFPSRN